MEHKLKVGDKVSIVAEKPADWDKNSSYTHSQITCYWNAYPDLQVTECQTKSDGTPCYKLGARNKRGMMENSTVDYLEHWLVPKGITQAVDPFHCTCSIQVVMAVGCACGAFKREQEAKSGAKV